MNIHGFKEFLIQLPVSCVKPIITGHLEMFFRDMLCKESYEIQYGNCFLDIGIILVLIVMEGYIFAIIGVNSGGGDDRPPKIPADILHDGIRTTQAGFGINIEPISVLAVNGSLGLFKRGANAFFHFIKEDSLESLPEIRVAKIF